MGNVLVWRFVAFHYLKLWDTQPKPIFSNKVKSQSRLRLGTTPLPTLPSLPPPPPRLHFTLRREGVATHRLKERLENYVCSYHLWLCSLAITHNINAMFVLKKATARTRTKKGKLFVSEFRSPSPAVLKHLNLNMKKKEKRIYSRIDFRLVWFN